MPAKSDIDDLPISKDLRVKGSEPRIILLIKKAATEKTDQWDKVCDIDASPAFRNHRHIGPDQLTNGFTWIPGRPFGPRVLDAAMYSYTGWYSLGTGPSHRALCFPQVRVEVMLDSHFNQFTRPCGTSLTNFSKWEFLCFAALWRCYSRHHSYGISHRGKDKLKLCIQKYVVILILCLICQRIKLISCMQD